MSKLKQLVHVDCWSIIMRFADVVIDRQAAGWVVQFLGFGWKDPISDDDVVIRG